MRTVLQNHIDIRREYKSYKKDNGELSFVGFLTKVLGYPYSEAVEIAKENEKILYKKNP